MPLTGRRPASDRPASDAWVRSLSGHRRLRRRYTARTLQVGVFVGIATLATAWAFGSRVNVTSERTMLIALSTIGLSMVFADPAGAVTSPSPTPLVARRLLAAAMGVTLAFAPWVVVRTIVALFPETAMPTGWEFLEWATIATSQLALGAATARTGRDASIGPGLFLAMLWWVLTAAPRAHEWLYEVGQHGWIWFAMIGAFVFLASAQSTDPASR